MLIQIGTSHGAMSECFSNWPGGGSSAHTVASLPWFRALANNLALPQGKSKYVWSLEASGFNLQWS